MYVVEIHVKGKIDLSLSDWFGELQVRENPDDETTLYGTLPDMSAVYGVISRLGSLVIPLVSVCIEETKMIQHEAEDEHPIHSDS